MTISLAYLSRGRGRKWDYIYFREDGLIVDYCDRKTGNMSAFESG